MKTLKRILVAGAAVLACVAVSASACGSSAPNPLGDRGGVEGAAPDDIVDVDWVVVHRNADGFPNIAMVCIDGLGFAVPSTGYGTGEGGGAGATPLIQVDAWDLECALHDEQ